MAATRPVIHTDGAHPKLNLQEALLSGKGPWTNAELIPAMQRAAAEKARLEAEELVPTPEAEF